MFIPIYALTGDTALNCSRGLEEEGVMIIQFPQLIKQIVSFLNGLGAINICLGENQAATFLTVYIKSHLHAAAFFFY